MRARAIVVAVLVLALVGCSPPGRKKKEVSPAPEKVSGTLPSTTAKAPSAKGDAAAGKTLFTSQGCGGCHTYKPAGSGGKIGPSLDNLEADAKKADHGPLPVYISESLQNPNAYVVPGYQGVMPSFNQLPDKQIADLVAFLTKPS